jgi:hypothetical protein
MSHSDPFDGLLRKALQSQDFPPIPASLLKSWQAARAENATKWLWIMPGMVFVAGIAVGVWLAPMGLGNALNALGAAFARLWHSLPEGTLAWAAVLAIAVTVYAFDGLRSVLARLK